MCVCANRLVLYLSVLFLGLSPVALAQLDATFPLNRMVFQRNNANQATFQVAGSLTTPLDRVEVQVVNRITSATVTAWTTVQTNPTNGQFAGNLTLAGGWYQLNFRGFRNNAVVGTDMIERVGVGEVFAVLGHSNAQGSSCTAEANGCYYPVCNACPTLDGATDDRVSCVQLNNNNNSANFQNPAFQQYEETGDNRYLPGVTGFAKLETYVGESPFARFAWFWGKMGDQLVQQLGVPVLLYNAGFGGSNMEHVYKSAYDIPFSHGWIRYDIRMPYVNIRNIMNLYAPSTGLRAILLQHGINDRGNQYADIKTHFLGVIDKVRLEFNTPNLAFVVAKDSYADAPFQHVRNAQDDAIYRGERANPRYIDNTFLGPDLDQVTRNNPAYSAEDNWNNYNLRWRPDGIHYSPSGQQEVANRWVNVLRQQSLLDSISPVLPQAQPLSNIACPGSQTGLAVGFPGGYSEYNWGDGTSNQSRTLSAGTYGVRLRATNNRIFFPPAVTIPNFTAPAQPTVSAVGGTPDLCTTNSLTLTTNANGPVRWSTNQLAQSISVSATGTYSASAVDLTYGCLSLPGSLSVGVGQSDLALSMSVDKRVARVGEDVQYALTITNKGPCDPGTLTWQNRLPANVQFVSTTDGLSLSNDILSKSFAGLAPNTSVTHRFRARLQQPGFYLNAAQILASGKTDPNSVPGSGTGDGQDDAAFTDVRTMEGGTGVYASSNPNQTTLPAVQSSQPTPDGATADLSLQLRSNVRVVRVGQSVAFSITVSNRGGATASTVSVFQTLPAGLQFVSSADGVTLNNGNARAIFSSLAPGQSATMTFVATVTAVGGQSTAAQISFSSPADSDSTPGNGYDNGEDDTARIEVRVEN